MNKTRIKISSLLIVFLFVNVYQVVKAEEVVIKCHAPSYATEEIVLYTFADQVTYTEKELARARVDTSGNFTLSFQANKPMKVFTYLEVFYVYLFVQPGLEYEIRIPVKTEKLPEDKFNPYFEPLITPAAVVSSVSKDGEKTGFDLNFNIKAFNDTFIPYFNKHVNQAASKKNADLTGTVNELKNNFDAGENEFFDQYITYKIGMLEYLDNPGDIESLWGKYFEKQPILYHNPAYMRLVNAVFDDFLSRIPDLDQKREIQYLVKSNPSYDDLFKILGKEKYLKDKEFREFVLVKALYDAYYAPEFDENSVLTILDQLIASAGSEQNKELAMNVKGRLVKLKTGTMAPSFSLYDLDSNLVSLEDYKGEYVYLNFCNTESYPCVVNMDMLKILHEQHEQDFKIVTISTDSKLEDIKDHVKEKGFEWDILHFANQMDVLEKYDIMTFPTYYLIGPGGKLLLSPAPAPNEGVQKQIFEIMKSNGDL